MKKHFLSLAMLLTALFLSSCLKDDLRDLEKKVDRLDAALGTNEPLKVQFSTTDSNDESVVLNTAYFLKDAGSENYIHLRDDGAYEIYVERFDDVAWSEGAWINVIYDPVTQTSNWSRCGVYYYDAKSRWINPQFRTSYEYNSIDVNVRNLDYESGKVDLVLIASTTSGATNNRFAGKPMSVKLSFQGTLSKFHN